MGFKTITRPVQDGEFVNASVTNREPQDAFDNTLYLKSLLDAVAAGSALFIREQRIDSAASVGSPVWYNPDTSTFEPALATVEVDPVSLQLTVAPESQVWGLVYTKEGSPAVGDILVLGFATLDMSLAIEGAGGAGLYFLSALTAGKVTQSRPAASIPVLRMNGSGQVLIAPQWRDILEAHVHLKFDLVCLPAGDVTPPSPGDRHVITNADSAVEGWLPADDPIFDNKAPSGAVFGYNLTVNQALYSAWPPLPLNGAVLIFDRGEDKDQSGQEVPLGSDGLAIINNDGIWWMSDCYGDVPWPTDLTIPSSVSTSSSGSSSVAPECPRDLFMTMRLYFIKNTLGASDAVVSSLKVAADKGLTLVDCNTGLPANVGQLLLDFDLNLLTDVTDQEGFSVFKDLVDNKFKRGPVVEGIRSLSAQLQLTSTHPVVQEDDTILHQGRVTFTLNSDPGGNTVDVLIVKLDGVTEEYPLGALALGFPGQRETSLRAQMNIKLDGLPAENSSIRIHLRILAPIASPPDLPALELTYRRIPKVATPGVSWDPLPSSDTVVPITTNLTVPAGTNQYTDVISCPIPVEPGDVVLLTLTRDATDLYLRDVMILQIVGVLEPTDDSLSCSG